MQITLKVNIAEWPPFLETTTHSGQPYVRARSHEQFFFTKIGSAEKKMCRCELKHVTKSHLQISMT